MDILGPIIILAVIGGIGYLIYGKLKKKWAKQAAEEDEDNGDWGAA